ncbi:MAG: hypothetical protein LBC38_01260 [Oscillospiraceae bacterium]|jgi:hypothetical protein|nr:hypothetical protein [Oscillospiraceae bacterium]
MDRETSLRLAPIFRGISVVLILLTFATWLFPYFTYDADVQYGIDISKGPLRFVPEQYPIDGATNKDNPPAGYFVHVPETSASRAAAAAQPATEDDFSGGTTATATTTDRVSDFYHVRDAETGKVRARAKDEFPVAVWNEDEGQYYWISYYDWNTNSYVGNFKTVSVFYRGTDALMTADARDYIRDYPDTMSMWEYILMAYNYPQLLAKRQYEGAKAILNGSAALPAEGNQAEFTMIGNKFYSADGSMIPLRDVKTADIDHIYVDTVPRFIRMWVIAPLLIQILIGVAGVIICIKKRGIMTQVFPLVFGLCGVLGCLFNRIVLSYTPEHFYAYVMQLVAGCLVLLVAIAGLIIQGFEIKTRPEGYYLPLG